MPWNSEAKSRSGGSRSGENPKQRMPSSMNDLASVPPESMYGTVVRAGVLGLQRRGHRVHQRAVERRLDRRQVGDPLPGDVRADQLVDLAQERLLPARDDPAVDHGLGRGRDDVGLVAGGEHRRVGGVADGRPDDPRQRAELAQRALQVVLRELQPGQLRHPREERADGVGEGEREGVVAQLGDRLGDLGDRVVVVQERPVPRPAAGPQPHPRDALLRRLDEVDAPVLGQGQGEPTDLTDRLGAAREQVRPVAHQPLRPVGPAGLLVGQEGEDDVPRRHDPVALEPPRDRDHHRDHVLHVDRAAPPHVAVLDGPGERMHRPLTRVGRHHVEMPVHEQRVPARIRPRAPG